MTIIPILIACIITVVVILSAFGITGGSFLFVGQPVPPSEDTLDEAQNAAVLDEEQKPQARERAAAQ